MVAVFRAVLTVLAAKGRAAPYYCCRCGAPIVARRADDREELAAYQPKGHRSRATTTTRQPTPQQIVDDSEMEALADPYPLDKSN